MNVVLCEYAEKREFTAGNKARTDAVRILKDCGYTHVPLFCSKSTKLAVLFQMFTACIKAITKAGTGDMIVIQYPYSPYIVNKVLISVLAFGRRIKGYRICLLIHDVIALRSEGDKEVLILKEIELFNKLDTVICHNETMRTVLQRYGLKANCIVLGLFDYLSDDDSIEVLYREKPIIIIAGNLSQEKSGYIYKLQSLKKCEFNLYGINYKENLSAQIHYMGAFHPDALIKHMEGNYGLVWDGDVCETCSGICGEYLRYNNPHKFSLYIAAGVPVIIWRESALAGYVQERGLGVCVDSLLELDTCIAAITQEQYAAMIENVLRLRAQLIKGKNLHDAVMLGK